MPRANFTKRTLRYRLPDGSIEEWPSEGAATAETVNHDHQGATDVVEPDVLPHARPCGPDQYFAAPILDEHGLMVALKYLDGEVMRIETMVEFWGRDAMRFDLVVTRHQPLVEWLREEGWIDRRTKVQEHVEAIDLRGKHVIGVLPLRLAAECRSVTEVPMNIGPDERRLIAAGDFGLDRVREVAGQPRRYETHERGRYSGLSKTAVAQLDAETAKLPQV